MTQTQSQFLRAFKGENTRIPVWFMRQAGRYLPEYQKLKQKHTLNEMFSTPEVIAEVTAMPVGILDVDAAILFADILTLPGAMGIDVVFEDKKGPVILNPIRSNSDVEKLNDFDGISYLEDGIQKTIKRLNAQVPLIGFAGAPFTVASYLVEGGSSVNFRRLLSLIYQNEDVFADLMEKLTKNTIDYLNYQKEHGIEAFQLFDTWGGILRMEDYERLVLPCVQRIFAEVDLPSIYYLRGASHLLPFMIASGADVLSVCHEISLGDERLVRSGKGVQGNFYNMLLYSDNATIERELTKLLSFAKRYPKYIFNLNHGVFPDVKPETLKFIVEKVHNYSWRA